MKARPKSPRKAPISKNMGQTKENEPITNAALQRCVKINLVMGKTSFSTLFHEYYHFVCELLQIYQDLLQEQYSLYPQLGQPLELTILTSTFSTNLLQLAQFQYHISYLYFFTSIFTATTYGRQLLKLLVNY